ncbi:MAG: hypothetical protein V3S51_04635 [Dehalococcoidia bacterium]
MSHAEIGIDSLPSAWQRTAKSRLRFELAGLAFARQKGFRPEDYAQHLWGKGAQRWMDKATPTAAEYLLKEAHAFKQFYPEVSFTVAEASDERAELVFTEGCLGGAGRDRWVLARSLGLTKEDVCAYCQEAFSVWAGQLSLCACIGPEDEICRLLVVKR